MAIQKLKTPQLALVDAKGAVAFVKKTLDNCELGDMSVKATNTNTADGSPRCIEIRGRVLEAKDFGLDLYLETKNGKQTVEFYLSDMPELKMGTGLMDYSGDLKKKTDVKRVLKGLSKAVSAAEAFENKLNEYKMFLARLNSFISDVTRNLER